MLPLFVTETRVFQTATDSTVYKFTYSFLFSKYPPPSAFCFVFPFVVSSQRVVFVLSLPLLHMRSDGKLPTANEMSFVTRHDGSNDFFNINGYSNNIFVVAPCPFCHRSLKIVISRTNENLSELWVRRQPSRCVFLIHSKYRVIHKSLRDFRIRLRNNQDRHGRTEHINR